VASRLEDKEEQLARASADVGRLQQEVEGLQSQVAQQEAQLAEVQATAAQLKEDKVTWCQQLEHQAQQLTAAHAIEAQLWMALEKLRVERRTQMGSIGKLEQEL
jgi:chromosome segregation ATPase